MLLDERLTGSGQKKFRYPNKLFWFCSLYPLFWMLLLYSFYFSAWIQLGHPPIPSLNDPKFLGIISTVFYPSVGSLFLVVLANFVVWCILYFMALLDKAWSWIQLSIFIIGCTLVFIQGYYDPFQIIDWYLD